MRQGRDRKHSAGVCTGSYRRPGLRRANKAFEVGGSDMSCDADSRGNSDRTLQRIRVWSYFSLHNNPQRRCGASFGRRLGPGRQLGLASVGVGGARNFGLEALRGCKLSSLGCVLVQPHSVTYVYDAGGHSVMPPPIPRCDPHPVNAGRHSYMSPHTTTIAFALGAVRLSFTKARIQCWSQIRHLDSCGLVLGTVPPSLVACITSTTTNSV
ncbi:hypothetical protein LIA77_09588 [Sarocladium implicatum]|nr:hypothetical protein LIA77_09588 [Sarocladium implicatum]